MFTEQLFFVLDLTGQRTLRSQVDVESLDFPSE